MAEDKLEDFIKKQVEQHQTPTDPAMLWEKIQAKQEEEEKPRRRFLIFWWLGSALLIGSIILALAYPLIDQPTTPNAAEQAITKPSISTDQLATVDSCLLSSNTTLDHTTTASSKHMSQAAPQTNASTTFTAASPVSKHESPTNSVSHAKPIAQADALAEAPYTNHNSDTQTNNQREAMPTAVPSELARPIPALPTPTTIHTPSDHTPNETNRDKLQNPDVRARGACDRLPTVVMQLILSNTIEKKSPISPQQVPTVIPQTESWALSTGVSAAYGQAQRTLVDQNANAADYLQIRQDTETPLDATRVNLDFQLTHESGWYAKTGVEYEQINERFEAYLEWDSTEVQSDQILAIRIARDGSSSETLGDGEVSTTYWTRQRIYNHYRSIDIPLIIGYQSVKTGSRLGWFIEGGASANVWFAGSGKIANTENRLSSLSPGASILRARTGISILGAAGINYRLTPSTSVWANPAIKYRLSSVTNDQHPVEQLYLNLAFNLGVRYHW